MKILESQSAQLTNYEVYTHLTELKRKSNDRKGNRLLGRPPGNLETIAKEVCSRALPVLLRATDDESPDTRLLR
jgi:hypothetical protein